MPPRTDHSEKDGYPEAVSDAVQPFSGFLDRKIQDILPLFGWGLPAHNLPRENFANFQGDHGTTSNLTMFIDSQKLYGRVDLPQRRERQGIAGRDCKSL